MKQQGRGWQLVTWAFATFAVAGLPGSAQADQPQLLRVLSYNIHHGRGIDDQLDLERIVRVIKSVEPDLVALQEVDQNARRTGSVDQPAEFARLTGFEVAYGPNIELQGGHYGNAVLSRWPIRRKENHLLESFDNGEQRGVLDVEIELPSGATVRFMNTHLDHRRDPQERLASAAQIERLIEARPDVPSILIGDLNATPESEVLKRFRQAWQFAGDGETLWTSPSRVPRRQIDYIAFRPADRWQVREVYVIDEPIASDHRPIFALLELVAAE